MLGTVLMVTAYTAMVTVLVYLFVYSKMYDWWKSPMGRVMNLSLIGTTLVAAGMSAYLVESITVARVLGIVGWLVFIVALVWRLRLLTSSYRARVDDASSNDYLASADYNHDGE